MKNREKVNAFFKQALHDTAGDFVLCTKGLSDGLGDFGQLKFLYDELKKVTMKKIKIAILSALPPKENEKVSNLFSDVVPKEDLFLFVAEDNEMLGNLFSLLSKEVEVKPNDYLVLYPYTYQDSNIPDSFLLKGHILAIKEMGLIKENILKTGDCGKGIGYGIPKWQHKEIFTLKPDWLVSCKMYTGTSQNLRDQQDRKEMFLKFIEYGEELGISSIVFIASEQEGNFFSKISSQSLKIEYFPFLNTDELRSLMDNTGSAIFSGGEAMFAESLGTSGPAASFLCARYNFQYMDIAQTVLQSNEMIRIDKTDLLNQNKYRLFFDENRNLIYYDDKFYYEVCNQFNKISGLTNEFFLGNKELSALLFPIMLNTSHDKVSFKIPALFSTKKEFYESSLSTFKKLKVNKWQKENWFSIIEEAAREE